MFNPLINVLATTSNKTNHSMSRSISCSWFPFSSPRFSFLILVMIGALSGFLIGCGSEESKESEESNDGMMGGMMEVEDRLPEALFNPEDDAATTPFGRVQLPN